MKYFCYSPLDMFAEDAYRLCQSELGEDRLVHVTNQGLRYYPIKPGHRIQALEETYLVRVEQDGSLRIVQKALS